MADLFPIIGKIVQLAIMTQFWAVYIIFRSLMVVEDIETTIAMKIKLGPILMIMLEIIVDMLDYGDL